MDRKLFTVIAFLLKSRLSVPLLVMYSLFTVLAVGEFVLSFHSEDLNATLPTGISIYFLIFAVPIIFLTPLPNKADAFNVFTLPIQLEKVYDYWFVFQFFYRILFLGFGSSVLGIDVVSPFYFPFIVEYALTGAILSSVTTLGRKMKGVSYSVQLVEVASFFLLPSYLTFLVTSLITLGSFGLYLTYRSRYDPLDFLSSIFQQRKMDIAQDKLSLSGLKGERVILVNRIKNPQLILTFNVSGQLRVIRPRLNGLYILMLVSGVFGAVLLSLSVFLKPSAIFLQDYFLGLVFYLNVIFQTQWIVMGTLAFERPWIGVQTLGVRSYFRQIHLSNMSVLTISWVVTFAFSAVASLFAGPKILMIALLSLPSTWLLYMILFVTQSSAMPNVQYLADDSQPYFANVRNVVGISILNVIPFMIILLTSVFSFLPLVTFLKLVSVEMIAITLVVALLLNLSPYYNYSTKVMSLKGYF